MLFLKRHITRPQKWRIGWDSNSQAIHMTDGIQSRYIYQLCHLSINLAECKGFEPLNHLRDCLLSRQMYSATLPTLHKRCFFYIRENSKTPLLSLSAPCFLQVERVLLLGNLYTLFTLEVRETAKSKIWQLIHIHFANFSVKWNCGMPYISNQPIIHFTLKSRLKESKRKKTFKQLLSMKWHLLLD